MSNGLYCMLVERRRRDGPTTATLPHFRPGKKPNRDRISRIVPESSRPVLFSSITIAIGKHTYHRNTCVVISLMDSCQQLSV